jgi:hypothetical protein
MIGLPPSARGLTGRPKDIADHASAVAREWEDVGERYVRRRMRELGISRSHVEALKAAAKTELPISDEARRLCRAMAQ